MSKAGFFVSTINPKLIKDFDKDYAFDYVKKMAYRYDRRTYRTKNKVITTLNSKYSELKAKDMQDKKTAKKIEAERKQKEKNNTKLKAIY